MAQNDVSVKISKQDLRFIYSFTISKQFSSKEIYFLAELPSWCTRWLVELTVARVSPPRDPRLDARGLANARRTHLA
jgi:hypothetical protein